MSPGSMWASSRTPPVGVPPPPPPGKGELSSTQWFDGGSHNTTSNTSVTEASCKEKKGEIKEKREREAVAVGVVTVLTESDPPLELELSNFFLLRVRVDLRRGVVPISASGLGLVTVRPPEGRVVATAPLASSGEARKASKAL